MDKITLLETAVLAGRAIADKEDFVYEPPEGSLCGCIYTTIGGEASCLIGVILELAGIERPAYNSANNGRLIFQIDQKERFTKDALDFLSDIQTSQDNHYPWGVSVESAVNNMNKPGA